MSSFTTSDGIQLSYYIDDSTRPWRKPDTLLLLHAAMGSAKRYFAWVPRLSGHYRVLRMDMRGHGASELPAPDKPLNMERLVQDVVELLDHANCQQAHIAGNSAGGYIGQNLALTHPDRVKSLMLFSSTPGLRQSQWGEWLKRVAEIGLRNFLAENIRDRLPVDQLEPEHIEWFLDEADKLDVDFGGRFVTLMTQLDWTERLHEIRCPTLIARPGLANIGSGDQYEEMHRRIPDSQLITYEGLPHHLTDAAPERCVDDVLAFLRWRFGAA
ncbi:alpha/beta fold hydrolase [Rhodoferax sediminis]|uniref:Alpha/beta hydrolase n=1 Tax=Rhodoferax sediminis TaxID=2509614 RepID=A0A515DDW5_9BURK|nr:alpha/beta hydrolase [Rhodoferax sediminis]QDL38606.1 alpha/beta hydrolase [Rhodoferax sediminis]